MHPSSMIFELFETSFDLVRGRELSHDAFESRGAFTDAEETLQDG